LTSRSFAPVVVRLAIALVVLLIAMPAHALAQTPTWQIASGGANLSRPVFWEAASGVTAADSRITITGSAEAESVPQVDRYGPRLHVSGDFGVRANLQSTTADLAVLALADGVPADQWGPAMRRVEVGTLSGNLVFNVFDGSSSTPAASQEVSTDLSAGPIGVGVFRLGGDFVLQVDGAEVARISDPGVFQSNTALLASRVAAGNQLSIDGLHALVPADQAAAVRVDRCTPTRLLAGGTDANGQHDGLWWIWPDDGFVREIEPDTNASDYLVAFSPDQRWVVYYQGPPDYNPATQRFVVDTWVMNLQTDERVQLVAGNSPIGWISDSSAVVLGERPTSMALVPTGEIVPTQGTLEFAQSMRSVLSPDQRLAAVIDRTPQGAGGISILDAASKDEVLHIQTGRGAPQLAWSPDSMRLAYTSGNDSPDGLVWRLRMMVMTDRQPTLVGSTQDLSLHSVLWAPPLSGCP
jgi:hypothetical protein